MAKTLVSQSNLRSINVRESSALTTSYVSSDSFNVQGANQLQLLVSFTKGSSEGCRLKVEFSEDGENWYQESAVAMSDTGDTRDAIHRSAFRKVESSSNIVVSIPLSASFFRISAAAITVGTGTSLSIMATIVAKVTREKEDEHGRKYIKGAKR